MDSYRFGLFLELRLKVPDPLTRQLHPLLGPFLQAGEIFELLEQEILLPQDFLLCTLYFMQHQAYCLGIVIFGWDGRGEDRGRPSSLVTVDEPLLHPRLRALGHVARVGHPIQIILIMLQDAVKAMKKLCQHSVKPSILIIDINLKAS